MIKVNEMLLQQLQAVEKMAGGTKWDRLIANPFKYLRMLVAKIISYRIFKKATKVHCKTFWGQNIAVILPSSSDIFLSGGKTHSSEIRLTKYLLQKTTNQDSFLDIGAHIGFFSLLMQHILPNNKSVHCIEPSAKTFALLQQNCSNFKNMQLHNCLLGNTNDQKQFYEFPELYAENNTANIAQFQNTDWIATNQPIVSDVNMQTGDQLLASNNFAPTIIKIDVEGSESIVLQGLQGYLQQHAPVVVMEFFNANKNNESHQLAEKILMQCGYKNFSIDDNGGLQQITTSTSDYFTNNNILSDNIVYILSSN